MAEILEYFAETIRAMAASQWALMAGFALILAYLADKLFDLDDHVAIRFIVFLLMFFGAAAVFVTGLREGNFVQPANQLAAGEGYDNQISAIQLAFGGAYDIKNDACNSKNPATSDCSCPDGFSSLGLSDAGVAFCYADPKKTKGALAFGGAYDPSGEQCVAMNPLTNSCGCPAGYIPLDLSDAGVKVCYSEAGNQDRQATIEFGGAFDVLGTRCVVGNPANDDKCSCPTGFEKIDLSQAGFSVCFASRESE